MAFFLSAIRFFLDCQPITAYNGVVMSDTSNEVEYEYVPGCTISDKAEFTVGALQELVEMKCRENMVRSLFKEINKQEESKWSVYDTLTKAPLFLVVDHPLAVRFSIGNENVEFSSNFRS